MNYITLVFTDIEESTQLWERHPNALLSAITHHDAMILEAMETFRGQKVKKLGDGLFLTFLEPLDALLFAVHIQRRFSGEQWPQLEGDERMRIRISLHHGDPHSFENDLLGLPVNRTSRLCAAGHGGQTLLSEAACRELEPILPDDLRLDNLGPYRLKGFSRFENVYQLSFKNQKTTFPPLKAMTIALPPERNVFVGREEILADLERLLTNEQPRLITLTGIGGMGKSRTALHLAHRQKSRFEAGIYFVELAPLATRGEVLPLLLRTLGVTIAPDADPFNTVSQFLDGQEALIILDNLEHLEGVEQTVAELLNNCPSARILATTRVVLPTWQQREVELPPLDVPEPAAGKTKIRRAKSVQLFLARAQNFDRSFQLTSENAAAVAEICRITAGIPLALELAAQLIQVYEPADLASRLQNKLLEIEAQTPELPDRLRSLRVAFEYSYHLLSRERRELLACLLAFRGGFTFNAVEAVCAGMVEDVEGAWKGLLDHRWVERQQKPGERRYRLLEPIAEFLREKAGLPSQQLCEAHATHYLRMAQEIDRLFRGRQISDAFRLLREELENFRAALRWACNAEAHEIVARLGAVLSNVMLDGGLWEEFNSWVGLAVRSARCLEDGPLLSQLATVKGLMAERQGDHKTAHAYYDEALEHGVGDWDVMRAHINLARLEREQENLSACAYHAEEVIRIAPRSGMQANAGLGQIFLASIREREEDWTEAERLWQLAWATYEAAKDEWGLAHWERERGQAKERVGELDAAKCYYCACLKRYARLGLQQHMTLALGRLAMVAVRQNDFRLCAETLVVANRFSGSLYSEVKVLTEVVRELRYRVGENICRQLMEEATGASLESLLKGLNAEDPADDRPDLAVARASTPARRTGRTKV